MNGAHGIGANAQIDSKRMKRPISSAHNIMCRYSHATHAVADKVRGKVSMSKGASEEESE